MVMSSSFEKSFRIKHEDNKFFSKLLSKENSKASSSSIPSFRVYYNDVPSSVPFTWELQPGTPKHNTFSETSLLPPLTPPPSYYSSINNNTNKNSIKRSSRSKIFHALIMKFNPKKSQLPLSPSSSSSSISWSSSSQYSSFSAPTTPSNFNGRRRFCSQESSFDNYREDISPASKLCFGMSSKASANSLFMVKKALFSIASGRGSN
ncbi:hypothetical protein A4A49_12347 [Nicotiana attenuata]|uniref:Uncharacterized protein n=1 Tax=Nicotiana attenuata TaxID=49451 RepID=A0A314KW37_NICAT|nr:hypothetical protein A4A49_12347 [Nicotiana attenuata]